MVYRGPGAAVPPVKARALVDCETGDDQSAAGLELCCAAKQQPLPVRSSGRSGGSPSINSQSFKLEILYFGLKLKTLKFVKELSSSLKISDKFFVPAFVTE